MNDVTRIIAVRHGQTVWNAEQRVQGQVDTALDARGRWQAQRLAEALRDEPIDAIVSSDLTRAMHTAAPLAQALALRVQPERALRERCFGVFEGFTYAGVEDHWPADMARWRARDPAFAPERGESLQTFYDRCVNAAQRLVAEHAGRTVVWFTHGGVLDCLYRAATRAALEAPHHGPMRNASINRLLCGDQGLMLVGWGDVGHLHLPAPAEEA